MKPPAWAVVFLLLASSAGAENNIVTSPPPVGCFEEGTNKRVPCPDDLNAFQKKRIRVWTLDFKGFWAVQLMALATGVLWGSYASEISARYGPPSLNNFWVLAGAVLMTIVGIFIGAIR